MTYEMYCWIIDMLYHVQNVYANMEGNVLIHAAIPALGMVATHWAVVGWSKQQMKRESLYDLKYIYRQAHKAPCGNLVLALQQSEPCHWRGLKLASDESAKVYSQRLSSTALQLSRVT